MRWKRGLSELQAADVIYAGGRRDEVNLEDGVRSDADSFKTVALDAQASFNTLPPA